MSIEKKMLIYCFDRGHQNKQLIENAKTANAYSNLAIGIIQNEKFYFEKDCIVLMKGIEKFNNDLMKVFKSINSKISCVHDFVSISFIEYQFALRYGCFDGYNELSGNPQNFIQPCTSGGRTMRANNEKQCIDCSNLRKEFNFLKI